MTKQNYGNRRNPAPVTVKAQGPRGLVEAVVEALESSFVAVRTSRFLENSEDDGVHVFLAVLGRRG